MHELAATESLLETVLEHARKNGARKVLGARLLKGGLNDLVDDTLLWLFQTLAADTIAAGAELDIKPLPIVFHCRHCGRVFQIERENFEARCDACGSTEVDLTGGREFYLETIDIE